MQHEPNEPTGEDHSTDYKARIGVRMFIIYALVYAGFVVINIAAPLAMEKTIIFGLNLATVYGFGLIIFALILAMAYNRLCTIKEQQTNHDE